MKREIDPDHEILAEAWRWEIVGLHLERAPEDGSEPFLDLTVRFDGERRRFRFWSPSDIEVERGGPRMTSGFAIKDIRARGLDALTVAVEDFEGALGATRFVARTVEALPQRAIAPLAAASIVSTLMQIRPFEDAQEDSVVALWSRCGLLRPWNDPHQDIARKRRVQRELFLVGEIDGAVVASVMAGYDGHRGWINYLAVDPQFRHRGLGRELMRQVESQLRMVGCSKINLQIRSDNVEALAFYERIGFSSDPVLSFGKRLETDHV